MPALQQAPEQRCESAAHTRAYSEASAHRLARAARISQYKEMLELLLRSLPPVNGTPGIPELWLRVRQSADGLSSALVDVEAEMGRQGIIAVAEENERGMKCGSPIAALELAAELNRLAREMGAAVQPPFSCIARFYSLRKAA